MWPRGFVVWSAWEVRWTGSCPVCTVGSATKKPLWPGRLCACTLVCTCPPPSDWKSCCDRGTLCGYDAALLRLSPAVSTFIWLFARIHAHSHTAAPPPAPFCLGAAAQRGRKFLFPTQRGCPLRRLVVPTADLPSEGHILCYIFNDNAPWDCQRALT